MHLRSLRDTRHFWDAFLHSSCTNKLTKLIPPPFAQHRLRCATYNNNNNNVIFPTRTFNCFFACSSKFLPYPIGAFSFNIFHVCYRSQLCNVVDNSTRSNNGLITIATAESLFRSISLYCPLFLSFALDCKFVFVFCTYQKKTPLSKLATCCVLLCPC